MFELAWAVAWFFGLACDVGWPTGCGCGAGDGAFEFAEAIAADARGDACGGSDGAGPWPGDGGLMLACRALEKLCLGAPPPPAEEEAGAAGAGPIMSRIETVIKQAAYAQAR